MRNPIVNGLILIFVFSLNDAIDDDDAKRMKFSNWKSKQHKDYDDKSVETLR